MEDRWHDNIARQGRLVLVGGSSVYITVEFCRV